MSAGLTVFELTAIVVVVVLAIVVLGVLLYLRRRLKDRRAQLLGELKDKPELVQDRAFNRLAMARREAEIMAGKGTDVSRPRELIAQSQASFDTRDYDRSYELAQQAHEALVNARADGRRAPLASSAPPGSSSPPLKSPSTGVVLASAASLTGASTAAAVATNLPKNRAESQFQLRLLDQELETARARSPPSSALANAEGYRTDAGAAFDRGDYTDAFRLALRGRRAVGAPVESLPVGAAAGTVVASPADRPVEDAARTAEIAAGAERCSKCGYPALPGDSFCRGCGQPRASASCPQCGAGRQPADTFCGRCGSAFA